MRTVGALLLVGLATACSSLEDGDAIDVVQAGTVRAPRELRTTGTRFVDRQGRTVILRGVNVGGNSKIPPFVPYANPRALDALAGFGMNAIRLPFVWEAFEPRRGAYDTTYLEAMRSVARDAHARGFHVIVDFHQDGFSRWSIGGCGSGFPSWTVPKAVGLRAPDNSAACADWGTRMFTDSGMHASFAAFYRNDDGVRDAFLLMVRRVARAFASVEGVVGYDLLNEPWGWDSELSALYADEGAIVRAEDPEAILFVEGHITTNAGLPTNMPRPAFANIAYAPHYYDPVTMFRHAYDGDPVGIDAAFRTMATKARAWDVPLFVGEFGLAASDERVTSYVARTYDGLDRHLASGTQWNYSPRWTPLWKDGWNAEDFSIVEPATGAARPNARFRPYPRATAGVPTQFSFYEANSATSPIFSRRSSLEYRWQNAPGAGTTEIVLPTAEFPEGSRIDTNGVSCSRSGIVLRCTGAEAKPVMVRVTGPIR